MNVIKRFCTGAEGHTGWDWQHAKARMQFGRATLISGGCSEVEPPNTDSMHAVLRP